MSSKNSNTSSSKFGRSQARYPADDGTSKSTFKSSFVDSESDPDPKPFLKGNNKFETLQRENARLKEELEDLRAQYQQLLEEGKEEVFEERRVNLLKAQVMQLERQVVLLSEGLSSQTSRCVDVEKALEPLIERLRTLLGANSPSAEVSIARAELAQLIEMGADVRQKLHRNNKVKTVENLSMPWILPKRNLVKEPVTLLDLCYGKMDNLNLQQVGALELRLSQLFKHLHGMRQTLGLLLAPGPRASDPAQRLLPPAVYARLLNQADQCSGLLERCCSDILTLSLILPSALLPNGEQQQVTQDLSAEAVLSVLPPFPQGAPQQRARRAAEALVRAANYPPRMARQQVDALQAELDFQRSLYGLQVRHTEGLIAAIRQAYRVFQDNVAHTLCSPLQGILSCYEDFKGTASELALRGFLMAFKDNAAQIQEAVEALDPAKNQGDQALSQYGREFFSSVEELLRRCAEERDRSASELQSLRQEQEEAQESLRRLRMRRESVGRKSEEQGRATTGRTSSPSERRRSEASEPVSTPAATPEPTQGASRNGPPSQQPRVTQRPANQRLGKNPPGSQSRKIRPRPEWQS